MATTRKNKTSTATGRTKPVEIKITVIGFADVLAPDRSDAGRGTSYEMKLEKKNPLVSIRGDVIYVKSPGANIRFVLAPSNGAKEDYFPTGITFVRVVEDQCELSEEQRLGRLNFPQRGTLVEGKSLSIAARFKAKESEILYKFSVVIQRGSDGKIGIIDPGISNDNSTIH